MKLFNRILISISILLVILYLTVGVVFYFGYTKAFYERIPLIYKTSNFASNILSKYGLHKLYNINLPNKKADFLLVFSKNDVQKKDSLINEIKNQNIRILEDRFKSYRNIKIYENQTEISAKYKFHGSSPTPYLEGYENYTIKAKSPVNGYLNFKLITGLEMNYFNIFLNSNAKKFELISEDSGDIVVSNINGKLSDYFQYEIFDENYITNVFKLENPFIVRRKTFDENISNEWHASILDNTIYNIDSETISKNNFKIWEKLNLGEVSAIYDEKYVGKFIAILELFGHPHQITGNNDKWVISDDKIYPVYRNEGMIEPINALNIINNEIFKSYYYSASLDAYKKMLSNKEIIYNRNLTFNKIVESKSEIITSLDSIYFKYENKHKFYNPNFLKLKLNHQYIKRTLSNNIDEIQKYLESGYTILMLNDSTLKLKSSRVNPLEIYINKTKHTFYPSNYEIDNNEIKRTLNEIEIKNITNIESLIIKDLNTKKTLNIEKDYSIIYIN